MKPSRIILYVAAGLMACGCSSREAKSLAEQPFDEGRSSVVWSEGDNPNGLDFGQNFEYVFDDLPTIGEVTTPPWAGSYWPTYLDSINHRWDAQNPDNLSPSEKYELAFEKTGITDAVSFEYGVDSMTHRTRCIDNSVCNSATGEVCSAKRKMPAIVRETWFGICHAGTSLFDGTRARQSGYI